jgi:hypothetical protein
VLPDEAGQAAEVEPVCIYMRQEVVGKEQLQNKTLRSLGLTQGQAMIRLIHRSQSQLKHQANVSAPLSRVAVPEEPERIPPPKVKYDSAPTAVPTAQRQQSTGVDPAAVVQPVTTTAKPSAATAEPMDVSESSTERSTPTSTAASTESSSATTIESAVTSSSASSDPVLVESSSEPPKPVVMNAQRYSKDGELHLVS